MVNGGIDLDSKLGSGSTFTFYMPCDELEDVTGALKNRSGTRSEVEMSYQPISSL
jgi:hypothetical protein